MKQKKSPECKALKTALKTLRFFYSVFLETKVMDETNHRKDYQSALLTIKEEYKKRKGT